MATGMPSVPHTLQLQQLRTAIRKTLRASNGWVYPHDIQQWQARAEPWSLPALLQEMGYQLAELAADSGHPIAGRRVQGLSSGALCTSVSRREPLVLTGRRH